MNKELVLSEAKKIFSQFETLDEGIFRAHLLLGSDKPAGIYYLDLSENEIEDFPSYQNKLLGKNFFETDSYLQWNNYLIILRENFDEVKKEQIELDDKYARKYIFNQSQFIDFFTLEESNAAIESNIVNKWKSQLKNADLQEVYGDDYITHIHERFIENLTLKNNDQKEFESDEVDTSNISTIDFLNLSNQFRPFPKPKKDFEFGKANLIFGSNGVGKTSILEAIELIICGKNFRDPKKKYPANCLEYRINHEDKMLKYVNNDPTFYRKRDETWYANIYPTGNNLQAAFNRYNFFNTDAAYDFANGSNSKQIKEALYNLILGKEYNHIKERAKKTLVRLKKEFKDLNTSKLEKENLITELNAELKSEDSNSNFSELSNSIIKASLKFKNVAKIENLNDQHSSIELAANNIRSILAQIKTKNISFTSFNEIDSLISKTEKEIKLIIDSIKKNTDFKNQIKDKREILKNITYQRTILARCSKYFQNEVFFNLKTHKKNLEYLRKRSTDLTVLAGKFARIELEQLDQSKSYAELFDSITKLNIKLEKEKESINKEIQTQLEKLDSLNSLVSEIKTLGIKYLITDNTANSCPLCKTTYSFLELKDRFSKSVDEDRISDNSELIKKLSKLESELKSNIDYLQNLKRVSETFTHLEFENPSTINLSDIFQAINNLTQETIQINNELMLKENLDELVITTNVSIEEFEELSTNLKLLSPELSFTFSNEDNFKLLIKSNNDKAAQLNKEISDLTKNIDSSVSNTLSSLNKTDGILLSDLLEEHTNRLNTIKSVQELSLDIKTNLEYSDKDSIDSIEIMISNLIMNLDTFKGQEVKRKYIEKLKARVSTVSKKLEQEMLGFVRLETAVQTLENIENEQDKEVENFIKSNTAEIVDIFKNIHSPKEFVEIKFDKKSVKLVDNIGKTRSLVEISTGQRSALALSIFISLNRKLKSPSIIMFDDPISFIDDFNALSFLDFLRYFVIKENKQIFLATANKKLAMLFRKKFAYLENDFKYYELERKTELFT